MKHVVSNWFSKPWYPILISAYPVLALLSANTGQVRPNAALRPLLASIVFGGLLFFISWIFLHRQAHKAAFLTTLLLALFFTYGHAYIYIDEKYPESNYTTWLAVGWGVLLLLALWWTTRPKLTFISSASSLNTVALALLVISLGQTKFESGPRNAHALGLKNAAVETDLVLPDNPPDVYFFLLDSYGRSDLLYSAYGFDNSEFVSGLESRDFYVAKCSQSNYVRTELSLGSSLNMAYLQGLDETFVPDSTSRRVLWDSLKHSAVRYNFENLGYSMVTFDTGFDWLNVDDSSHFMSPPPISSGGMTDFEGLFLRTTAARYAQDLGLVDPDYLLGVGFRDRFNFVFSNIDNITKIQQPTFSYIHIISPHPPFVFDPEGNPTYPPDFWNEQRQYPPDLYQKGYVNQVPYLNKNMLQAIDTILANSETPPIIIVQSDHGPWLQPTNKRFWNFTAIYFPQHKDVLYSKITPVNIFRLVFNTYFGGKYDILDDVSYFSPVPNLYDFSKITNSCVSKDK